MKQTCKLLVFPDRIFSRRALCHGVGRLAALALLPSAAFAQAAAAETPGVSTGAILQMLLGLALIVGLLFAGAYLLRRLNGGRNFGNSGPLRVVGGVMLGTRERIVLIEVSDEWIVVGIVPGQIRTLHTLPRGEVPAPAMADKPFAQWLKQMTVRNDDKK